MKRSRKKVTVALIIIIILLGFWYKHCFNFVRRFTISRKFTIFMLKFCEYVFG